MVDPFTLIEPALVVVRAYQVKYHRVPGALVGAVIAEIEKLPLSIQIDTYQRILTDFADIAGHFVDPDDDDDGDDGPAAKDGTHREKRAATVSQMAGLEHQRGYQ